MRALTLTLVLAAGTASAQPAADCTVTIARAPDDVREVVESWLRAEPPCTHTLEVRIVPSEGDLYLFVRDEHGRVRERLVPDARSAGILIASWAADDGAPSRNPLGATPPAPVTVGSTATEPPPLTPSGPPGNASDLSMPVPSPTHSRARWVALGGTLAVGNTGTGLRGEADVVTSAHGSLGVAATVSRGTALYAGSGSDHVDILDATLLGQLAGTWRAGRWYLRPAIAAGGVYTRVTLTETATGSMSGASGVYLIGQAQLMIGRDLGTRWGLALGPVVTLYSQRIDAPTFFLDRPLEAVVFGAVRYRL
ncbi:MAG: hypothetical protein IPQ07_25255 [Myxococcales bacterium]|nr:hypothetical protein [Myxococcales bacterium]